MDIWALGVVLYQMCSGRVLFISDSDNLNQRDLHILLHWSDQHKRDVLSEVKNKEARNLVSRLLSKDPGHRPSLAAVLAHPFISGKEAVRMVGDQPVYDVFLSYRVAADCEHAEQIYSMLVARGLAVWWDKKSLKAGVPWEEGFCNGLIQSRTFVCLMSEEALAHPNCDRQSFTRLSVGSPCDNVLLEYQLALEL
eukprot:gene36640-biopygen15342